MLHYQEVFTYVIGIYYRIETPLGLPLRPMICQLLMHYQNAMQAAANTI